MCFNVSYVAPVVTSVTVFNFMVLGQFKVPQARSLTTLLEGVNKVKDSSQLRTRFSLLYQNPMNTTITFYYLLIG